MQRKQTSKPPRLAPVTPGETSLSEMIALAEAGDTRVAREVLDELGQMVDYAGHTNKLPRGAAAYLARVLADIAAGKDANKVFNLKSKGRPREWPHEAKVLAVDIMNQLIEQGRSIDEAAAEGSVAVNDYVKELAERRRVYLRARSQGKGKRGSIDPADLINPWKVFISRAPLNTDTLEPIKSWYLELLNPKKKPRKRRSPRK
jgi:hypothetical protein